MFREILILISILILGNFNRIMLCLKSRRALSKTPVVKVILDYLVLVD